MLEERVAREKNFRFRVLFGIGVLKFGIQCFLIDYSAFCLLLAPAKPRWRSQGTKPGHLTSDL
jgi:hypothetical protein